VHETLTQACSTSKDSEFDFLQESIPKFCQTWSLGSTLTKNCPIMARFGAQRTFRANITSNESAREAVIDFTATFHQWLSLLTPMTKHWAPKWTSIGPAAWQKARKLWDRHVLYQKNRDLILYQNCSKTVVWPWSTMTIIGHKAVQPRAQRKKGKVAHQKIENLQLYCNLSLWIKIFTTQIRNTRLELMQWSSTGVKTLKVMLFSGRHHETCSTAKEAEFVYQNRSQVFVPHLPCGRLWQQAVPQWSVLAVRRKLP